MSSRENPLLESLQQSFVKGPRKRLLLTPECQLLCLIVVRYMRDENDRRGASYAPMVASAEDVVRRTGVQGRYECDQRERALSQLMPRLLEGFQSKYLDDACDSVVEYFRLMGLQFEGLPVHETGEITHRTVPMFQGD